MGRAADLVEWIRTGNLDIEMSNSWRRRRGRPLMLHRHPRLRRDLTWTIRRLNRVLADMAAPTTYLEIGVRAGTTIENLHATHRIGVDPHPTFDDTTRRPRTITFHRQTSDEYFAGAGAHVHPDVVYVDGLHTFAQAYRDLVNALDRLTARGVVLVDDTLPYDEVSAIPDQEQSYARRRELGLPGLPWHGDVWKVAVAIAECHPELDHRTIVGSGNGQTLVWRRTPGAPTRHAPSEELQGIGARSYADVFGDDAPPAVLNPCSEDEAFAAWAAHRGW